MFFVFHHPSPHSCKLNASSSSLPFSLLAGLCCPNKGSFVSPLPLPARAWLPHCLLFLPLGDPAASLLSCPVWWDRAAGFLCHVPEHRVGSASSPRLSGLFPKLTHFQRKSFAGLSSRFNLDLLFQHPEMYHCVTVPSWAVKSSSRDASFHSSCVYWKLVVLFWFLFTLRQYFCEEQPKCWQSAAWCIWLAFSTACSVSFPVCLGEASSGVSLINKRQGLKIIVCCVVCFFFSFFFLFVVLFVLVLVVCFVLGRGRIPFLPTLCRKYFLT